MIERKVEGLIYAAMFHQEVKLSERFHDVPTVLVDCFAKDKTFPSVVPDEVQGGRTATEKLIEKGHEDLGNKESFEKALEVKKIETLRERERCFTNPSIRMLRAEVASSLWSRTSVQFSKKAPMTFRRIS